MSCFGSLPRKILWILLKLDKKEAQTHGSQNEKIVNDAQEMMMIDYLLQEKKRIRQHWRKYGCSNSVAWRINKQK